MPNNNVRPPLGVAQERFDIKKGFSRKMASHQNEPSTWWDCLNFRFYKQNLFTFARKMLYGTVAASAQTLTIPDNNSCLVNTVPPNPFIGFCGPDNNWTGTPNAPYSNSGDNTTSFVGGYGGLGVASDGTVIKTVDGANGWTFLPCCVGGDFEVTLDVFLHGDYIEPRFQGSNDVYILFLDSIGHHGYAFRACPNNSDTNICLLTLCCNWQVTGNIATQQNPYLGDGVGFYSPFALVNNPTKTFGFEDWYTATFSRVAGVITGTISGQSLSYDTKTLDTIGSIAIGYYTGGPPQYIKYRNISVVNL